MNLREKVNAAADIIDELEDLVSRAVNKYNSLCDEYGLPTHKFKDGLIVEVHKDFGVTVSWEENWSYGGHDSGEYDLKISELDPETNEEIFREYLEKSLEKRKNLEAEQTRILEKKELELLKSLQEKYGDAS